MPGLVVKQLAHNHSPSDSQPTSFKQKDKRFNVSGFINAADETW
jgi:hypothetical protein